eukprot:INCI10476.2.p5 GENE.INCI10476.2~~INCI10476.2.p5  ORF type:complete len:105 (-),score=17.68 INCI10476.2:694-1008(-)
MGVRKKGVSAALEAFKFAIFLSMPVATVVYFNTPDALVRVIEHKRYIEFPAEQTEQVKMSAAEKQALLNACKEELVAERLARQEGQGEAPVEPQKNRFGHRGVV